MKFLNRSEKGFNTIEMMVGVAILAIVALAAASLAQVTERATSYADHKTEFNALSQLVMERLKNEDTCASTLSGNSLSSANSRHGQGHGHAYGTIKHGTLPPGQIQDIYLTIPGIQSGADMQQNVIDANDPDLSLLYGRKLQVNYLGLQDAIYIDSPSATSKRYLVSVALGAKEINGIALKPQVIGSIVITMDDALGDGAIASCESMPADAMQTVCTSSGMGCQWDPNSQPNCRCVRTSRLCTAPGYYPTKFINGNSDCVPMGGSTCPAGEYLVGVSLGAIKCASVPTTCPTGTSTNGAGNPVFGLINCKCNLAGQTYYSNSGCQAPATPTPTPTPAQGSCYLKCSRGANQPGPLADYCTNTEYTDLATCGYSLVTGNPPNTVATRGCMPVSCSSTPTPTPTPTPAATPDPNLLTCADLGCSCPSPETGPLAGAVPCGGFRPGGEGSIQGDRCVILSSQKNPPNGWVCGTDNGWDCPLVLPNGCSSLTDPAPCPNGSSQTGTGAQTNIDYCKCDAATPDFNGARCVASGGGTCYNCRQTPHGMSCTLAVFCN